MLKRHHLKEDDFEEPGNNRSISLLPILSELCKKVALRVSEHPIPKNKQMAGGGTEPKKKWHSTETSFTVSMNAILEVVDKRN